MRTLPIIGTTAIFHLILLVNIAQPQELPMPSGRVAVAVAEAPPFAMRGEDGEWHGISIALWELIARNLALRFEYTEVDADDVLDTVANGEADVALGAIIANAEGEERVDYSHVIYSSGLGIAIPTRAASPWAMFRHFFTWEFFTILLLIVGSLLAATLLVWAFERRENAGEFGGSPLQGIGAGFWWSAVTMTAVGYGDKSPKTVGGRVIAFFWMYASIIAFSVFTAAIASYLTTTELRSGVSSFRELRGHNVATVAGTSGEAYLSRERIQRILKETPKEALRTLRDGQADAVVLNRPLLLYLTMETWAPAAEVLSDTLHRQDYVFVFPANAELREAVDRELLRALEGPSWKNIRHRYLGE